MPKIISISQIVLEIIHGNETGQTDGRTDRRDDSYIPPLNFVYRGYNKMIFRKVTVWKRQCGELTDRQTQINVSFSFRGSERQ